VSNVLCMEEEKLKREGVCGNMLIGQEGMHHLWNSSSPKGP